jgi:hypothetical protein
MEPGPGQCLWPVRSRISQLEGLVREPSNDEASDQLEAFSQLESFIQGPDVVESVTNQKPCE